MLGNRQIRRNDSDSSESDNIEDRDTRHEREISIQEEIVDFLRSFPDLRLYYNITTKIGEGTFSSVYSAVELNHRYSNEWCSCSDENCGLVAIKRLYVTSSPQRLYNEINMVAMFDHPNVIRLITAKRFKDNVIAVFPLFKHVEFRTFFFKMSVQEIKNYTRSLIAATAHIHSKGIIHRDIKPNNFLFNRNTQTGMLVDFGLAQYANTTICTIHKPWREPTSTLSGVTGHVVDDPRPTFKPPTRAGTRGFRSPEVLLKYPNQSIAIDVWSCGVILATMFTGRYPIFHCQEDVEALLELADIYGLDAMRKVARYCGRTFDSSIPFEPKSWKSIVERYRMGRDEVIPPEGLDLLDKLLKLMPEERITAREALQHPFLRN